MDVNITLSIINMKLRDFYDSLEALLDDLDNAEEMVNLLLANGYKYDKASNQFK